MPNCRCRRADAWTSRNVLRLAVGVPCGDTADKGASRGLADAVGAPVGVYVGAVSWIGLIGTTCRA